MITDTSHQLTTLFLQLGLLLLIATALGITAARFGLPAVVGELLTGVLLGPSVLGHISRTAMNWLFPPRASSSQLLDAVGEFGVILLVGMIGAQLDGAFVRRSARTLGVVSLCSLAIPLAAGFGVALLLPATLMGPGDDRLRFALLIGIALAVSALPVVAKILADMGILHRDIAQLILASGTVDDALAWFALAILSAGLTFGQLGWSAVKLLAILAAALLLRPVIRRLTSWAVGWDERTVAPLAVVVIVLGASGAAALGFEPVFGAFISGALLYSAGASLDAVRPLRSVVMTVLAPIFMATAGLRMDLSDLGQPAILASAVIVLALAVVTKFGGAYLGSRLCHLGHWNSVALGAGLNARGVVQIVVAATGLRLGLVSTSGYTALILVAIATSIMTPPLLRAAVARIPGQESESVRQDWLGPPPRSHAESSHAEG